MVGLTGALAVVTGLSAAYANHRLAVCEAGRTRDFDFLACLSEGVGSRLAQWAAAFGLVAASTVIPIALARRSYRRRR